MMPPLSDWDISHNVLVSVRMRRLGRLELGDGAIGNPGPVMSSTVQTASFERKGTTFDTRSSLLAENQLPPLKTFTILQCHSRWCSFFSTNFIHRTQTEENQVAARS